MDRLMLISCDNHVGANPRAYLPYVEERHKAALLDLEAEEAEYFRLFAPFSTYSEEALAAIDADGRIRGGGPLAARSSRERVKQLDLEGIAGEIVHVGHQGATTPWFSQINRPHPAEMRWVGVKAYHRWLADDMADADGRAFGVGDSGPCLDMAATVAELHWIADHGFVSVSAPGNINPHELPPVYDRSFEPFWAACAERGLVLSVHAGWGTKQGSIFDFITALHEKTKTQPDDRGRHEQLAAQGRDQPSPFALNIGPRRLFWQLMLGGVFDRHPDLRLCLTEVRADWIPATLDELDRQHDAGDVRFKMKPSDYFRAHVWVTPSSPRRNEIAMRHKLGLEHFMFGVDFPHPEGTWPNSREWIRDAFVDVPDHEVRMILGENAIDCYGLPADRLRAVADRIGIPAKSVLSGDRTVPRGILDSFNARAGYNVDPEVVDLSVVRAAYDEDRARLAVLEG